MNIPRAEHPNPQWERKNWRNLNGLWEFEWDYGCSAVQRRLWEKETFAHTILVPFCPESKLSGLAHTDFIPGVAYRRTFSLSEQELSGRVLLHFGAVDYEAWVYVNGQPAGTHKGGYTSFSLDVTPYVTAGENTLFVAARDDVRSGLQPKGKQADQYYSSGCDYTRTTGIWQTVWLEFVPETYLQYARYYPDPQNGCVTVSGLAKGEGTLRLTALWAGKPVGEKTIAVQDGFFTTQLDLEEIHLWEAGKGGLYTLLLSLENDQVSSYFGLRTVAFQGRKFLLNGKPLFQRFVLDQGFYPDGIYTAPTEEDLIQDITLSFAAGFNGARLHEKVFEPRFLYHCDRLGYLVWGEFPNWGLDHSHPLATEIVLNQWSEAVERDCNHPAIIGWCPFNETWGYHEEKEQTALQHLQADQAPGPHPPLHRRQRQFPGAFGGLRHSRLRPEHGNLPPAVGFLHRKNPGKRRLHSPRRCLLPGPSLGRTRQGTLLPATLPGSTHLPQRIRRHPLGGKHGGRLGLWERSHHGGGILRPV